MLSLEFGKLDTLVELAIVDHDDWFPGPCGFLLKVNQGKNGTMCVITYVCCAITQTFAFSFHYDFIVDPEFTLRHAGEIRFHDHLTGYVSRQHLT